MANTRREKELARQRAERQSARRAAAAARRRQRNAVIASMLAVALVAGAAVSLALATRPVDDGAVARPEVTASAIPSPRASSLAPGDCAYTPTGLQPARPAPVPPGTDVEDEQVFTVTLATSQGEISFEADSAAAPCTVNSFRSLAEAGYFDDTACHRLTTAGISVLQCGDPSATGGGDPGYTFPDENLDGATYPRGTVAMANSGPDTNGSQFFLVYADSSLPPSYTPFGTLSAASLEVLDTVAAGGVAPGPKPSDGKPAIPVQIVTATVTPKAAA